MIVPPDPGIAECASAAAPRAALIANSTNAVRLPIARPSRHTAGNLGIAALLRGRLDEARSHLAESVSVRRKIQDAFGLASVFTSLAALAAEEGAFARAAHLLGAVDAMIERTDAELEPIDEQLYERSAAAAGASLGPERFASARDEGRGLSLDEAAAFALDGASESIAAGSSVESGSGARPS